MQDLDGELGGVDGERDLGDVDGEHVVIIVVILGIEVLGL